jgi:hypothetical protein
MAQQIKKKFIGQDQVDGSKVKLLKDQSLRGQKQDGSDVELLKLDGSDKLVSDGQEIAFKSQVDAEQARAEGEESRIEGLLSQEVSDRQSEVSRVEGLLSDEEAARIAGDLDLQGQMDSEESARISADQTLQSNLDSEVSRAEGEESRIEGKVDQEISDRQSAISTEEAARIAGDASTLASANEYTDGEIETLSQSVNSQLEQEIADREAADANLQSQVNTEKGRIDAILSASQADKDSFAEIVDLINSVDTENDSAFASYVLSNNAALAQEVSDRQSGDQTLQSNIDSEESRAMGVESDLQSQIDSEESRAMGVESSLQSQIDAEESRAMGVESDLQSQIDTEESRAMSAESALSGRVSVLEADPVTKTYVDTQDGLLQTAITAEETARIAGDAALMSTIENLDGYALDVRDDLDAEIAARIAGDLDLQGQIDSEEAARIAAVSAEQSARETADSTEQAARIAGDAALQASLTQEISDRQSAVSAEASARESADTTLQSNIDAEESRAMGEESRIESKFDGMMSDEQTAREAADTVLQSNIDVEKGRIDAILSASDADKDSFAEIVQLINSVDTENDSAFAGYVLSNNQALADEVSAREAGDLDLQGQIDSEESRAMGVEQGLQTSLDQEISNRQAADQQLQTLVYDNFLARDTSIREVGYESMTGQYIGNMGFVMAPQWGGDNYDQVISYSGSLAGDELKFYSNDLSSGAHSKFNYHSLQLHGTNNSQTWLSAGALFVRCRDRQVPDDMYMFDFNSFDAGQIGIVKEIYSPEGTIYAPSMPTMPSSLVVKAYVDQEVSDLQTQIDSITAEIDGPFFEKQKFVIDETSELSSIELSHECIENSLVVCVGRLMAHKDEDYSVSVVDGKTVLTWMGDFAQGGSEGIESGDVIFVTFAREV